MNVKILPDSNQAIQGILHIHLTPSSWYMHSYFELRLPSSDHAIFTPPPVYISHKYLLNTLSLCISSTLFTLFFRNHSIRAFNDFLKIGNKKATDVTRLPCCHFYKIIYAQKFVNIAQTVLWIILSIFHYKMIIDFLEIVVLRFSTKLEKAQPQRVELHLCIHILCFWV